MSDATVFSRRLREARLRTGLSQKAFGVQAGIDEFSASPRMNQYERGKHLPDLLTMEHLALVANVPLPYFFAEDEVLAELLSVWKLLNEEGRGKVLATAQEAGTDG